MQLLPVIDVVAKVQEHPCFMPTALMFGVEKILNEFVRRNDSMFWIWQLPLCFLPFAF